MIGQFIAVLFLARDIAHREHLRTQGPGSGWRHDALGDFYPAVVDLADRLTEVYQGAMLKLIDIPLLDNEFTGEIEDSMKAQRKWIKDNRYKAVPREETHMHQIIDDIVELYDRTIFKLHFLE
jgi:hypothetical protein